MCVAPHGVTVEKRRMTPMLPLLAALMLAAAPLRADPLARAFDLAAQGQWPEAATLVAPLGPVAADILEWQRLRAGQGTLTDYERFLSRHPD